MAVMPVRRLLLNMSWPMMLSMLIQALYNLVDSIFVAQLSGAGFEALSLVYPVQTLMIAVCVGTGIGVNSLLSRRLGEGRPEEANAMALHGYLLYFLTWAAFSVVSLTLLRRYMWFFTDNPVTAVYGLDYLTIVTVRLDTARPLIFDDVVVRVRSDFAAAMHIDTDESNAACAFGEVYGEIRKK